mmetsp:Transcript_46413/g.131252  ORF Transcript_46413/g.131252 Transcript_46413/m.131252 type:complete len:253 (-) Transcript_46413:526-1284(-)
MQMIELHAAESGAGENPLLLQDLIRRRTTQTHQVCDCSVAAIAGDLASVEPVAGEPVEDVHVVVEEVDRVRPDVEARAYVPVINAFDADRLLGVWAAHHQWRLDRRGNTPGLGEFASAREPPEDLLLLTVTTDLACGDYPDMAPTAECLVVGLAELGQCQIAATKCKVRHTRDTQIARARSQIALRPRQGAVHVQNTQAVGNDFSVGCGGHRGGGRRAGRGGRAEDSGATPCAALAFAATVARPPCCLRSVW